MRIPFIEIADELRGLASNGLAFSESHYDRERYEKVLAIAAQLAAAEQPERLEDIEALFRQADLGYVTPKLDVRMAVFRSDQILLVQEAVDQRWAMPGGFVDIGDSPAEAAARETSEEAGVEVRVRQLVGVFDNRAHPEIPTHVFHIHKLVFIGELIDPNAEPRGHEETLDARFFGLDDLPELSLGRTVPLHLREAARVANDPLALPYFD